MGVPGRHAMYSGRQGMYAENMGITAVKEPAQHVITMENVAPMMDMYHTGGTVVGTMLEQPTVPLAQTDLQAYSHQQQHILEHVTALEPPRPEATPSPHTSPPEAPAEGGAVEQHEYS